MRAVGRLAPADEANLVLDRPGQVNVFLVAGVASGGFVDAGGTPDLGALRAAIARRIDRLPSLRVVPQRAARGHRWAEVVPDLDRHVRLAEAVDGLAGLEDLCGGLMTVPLALDRPLWELLVVPGVAPTGVGVVLRIHHAIADGMAAVGIVERLLDPVESVPPASPGESSSHGRAPSPPEQRASRRSALARFAFGAQRILLTVRARGIGPTVLLEERGAARRVAFLSGDLAALSRRARSSGATLNDALLEAAAAGYRAALEAAGEELHERLPVSVPVALPRREGSANQVGVMVVQLPLTEPDTDRRLRLIAEQTRAEKARARDQGTLELMRGPLGARLMNRLARRQHFIAGFLTNVPGPARELRLADATIEALWPVGVLAANVRLGIAAISYAGRVRCSVQYDADLPAGSAFAREFQAELGRLAATA